MQEFEIELGIGDAVRIGENVYTVVDIDRGEVCLRVDSADEHADAFETVPPAK